MAGLFYSYFQYSIEVTLNFLMYFKGTVFCKKTAGFVKQPQILLLKTCSFTIFTKKPVSN